jgi:hypothetical protein
MRVIHIVESTLGGVRRYLESIVAVSDPDLLHSGLVYSSFRSDTQFRYLLEKCHALGWKTYEIEMEREINLKKDIAAIINVRKIIRIST